MTVRIGITCNRVGYENRLSLAYVRAVAAAGAAPLLLPVCRQKGLYRQMLKAIDALLLSGGGDLDAYHFGEEAAPTQGVWYSRTGTVWNLLWSAQPYKAKCRCSASAVAPKF